MKLNKSQAFGVIVGHEWARYEQNGMLFDGHGNAPDASAAIDKASKKSKSKTDNEAERRIQNAAEFLKTLLAGGPVETPIVYREAENTNLQWVDVKAAFARLQGTEFKRGEAKLWRIHPEFMEKQ